MAKGDVTLPGAEGAVPLKLTRALGGSVKNPALKTEVQLLPAEAKNP